MRQPFLLIDEFIRLVAHASGAYYIGVYFFRFAGVSDITAASNIGL